MKDNELSIGFKMPPIDKYNGRGDPTDHINVYKMKLQGYNHVIKCRNFDTTFVSDAKYWYNKLKLRSIRSWTQLKQQFINAFISNCTTVSDMAELGESVKIYS
ncbi:Retrotrans gag domain-containing protein [Abeliophyllum distichum]|uniref:Retrotrans gag domain-containing protein n=1 Tax=Abeliophyllum distichum TaxID=126358 RepID=A0ABD1PQ58_9LAMI